ncbi:hypothetical protein [Polaribacter butkevichii]|uniref:hypothetical protein n=1 Tax=Polaribacter butkevichii TaxID=218490 RepID=UPI0014736C0F|nr:hypothetical protein [Polaribacter butkevichii]
MEHLIKIETYGRKKGLQKILEPLLNCKNFTVPDEIYKGMFYAEYDTIVTLLVLVDL